MYNALVDGREPQLPELEIQYGDYAVWQQQWMESGGLDQQLSYWTEQLAGAPALLELPTDHPRPPEQSFRGATERAMLPRELLERLRSIGEREGATLFMTLLAAYMTMLARYSGQDDIVVASPVANRNRVELEGVIGLFVNTLALRIDLERQTRRSWDCCSASARPCWRPSPIRTSRSRRLVQELNPVRDRGHAPVAQVLFVVQNDTGRPAALEGLQRERVPAERGTAKFDLALFAAETADGLRISIEYCTDLFDTATIARMLVHYRVLLESIASDPSRQIGELELLAPDERTLILDTWNATDADFPAERCIHELVAEQARRTPRRSRRQPGHADAELRRARRAGRPACPPPPELGRRTRRRGRHLDRPLDRDGGRRARRAQGRRRVRPDRPELPARPCRLHALRRRRVRAPDQAEPGLPPAVARRAHDLPRLRLGATIAGETRGERRRRRRGEPRLRDLHLGVDGTAEGRGHGTPSAGQPTRLATGSASQPAAARTLQFASLSFDVAFQEIFSTWCTGGELVLTDDDTRRNAHALVGLLADAKVERLFLPFVALQGVCEAAEHLGVQLPALRDVITAGEQLKITLPVRRFFTRHAGCRLFNHYGPTESHVVTSFELPADREAWPELPPIGRPIANARIYLLDRHRRPAPIGVAADLYIGGISLARGYLNRPELTEERFVPDPFSSQTGARLYRSGDRARYLPDGQIEFLGRGDDQVKVRGFRVELGEIEAGLAAHPDVIQAVAALREDEPGDVRLVGYVVTRSGSRADQLDLLEHTRRLLPEHLIPQHFVSLETVPLTPSGKVDRKSLPGTRRQFAIERWVHRAGH